MDVVDIQQFMKTLFTDSEGILQFINTMEAAQTISKRADLEVSDEYMHAVVLKLLLATDKYKA